MRRRYAYLRAYCQDPSEFRFLGASRETLKELEVAHGDRLLMSQDAFLAHVGQLGWELTAILDLRQREVFYFKRELEDEGLAELQAELRAKLENIGKRQMEPQEPIPQGYLLQRLQGCLEAIHTSSADSASRACAGSALELLRVAGPLPDPAPALSEAIVKHREFLADQIEQHDWPLTLQNPGTDWKVYTRELLANIVHWLRTGERL